MCACVCACVCVNGTDATLRDGHRQLADVYALDTESMVWECITDGSDGSGLGGMDPSGGGGGGGGVSNGGGGVSNGGGSAEAESYSSFTHSFALFTPRLSTF